MSHCKEFGCLYFLFLQPMYFNLLMTIFPNVYSYLSWTWVLNAAYTVLGKEILVQRNCTYFDIQVSQDKLSNNGDSFKKHTICPAVSFHKAATAREIAGWVVSYQLPCARSIFAEWLSVYCSTSSKQTILNIQACRLSGCKVLRALNACLLTWRQAIFN